MVETQQPLAPVDTFPPPETYQDVDSPNEGGTEALDQETEEVKEQLNDSDNDPNKSVT